MFFKKYHEMLKLESKVRVLESENRLYKEKEKYYLDIKKNNERNVKLLIQEGYEFYHGHAIKVEGIYAHENEIQSLKEKINQLEKLLLLHTDLGEM